MRALFLLLILATAGLWAWNHWIREPQAQAVPVTHLKAPSLTLWSDLTEGQKRDRNRSAAASQEPAPAPGPSAPQQPDTGSAATSQMAAGPSPQAQPACARIGPFADTSSAAAAVNRLSGEGLTVRQRTIPGKVRLGYWVVLPEYANRAAAESALKRLKARGVKDLYIVADGAHRNAISLGVYSEKAGARQRAAEIRRLGFKPDVRDRFRDAPVHWLDIIAADGQLPDLAALDLVSGGPDPVNLKAMDCPPPDVAGGGGKP